jgi:hypothetical protein
MFTTKLAATLAVIAASTIAPSIATASPSHAQPWLDWGNSVIESTPAKYTTFLPVSTRRTKNELSIETLEPTAAFWVAEVNDEVL